MAGVATSKRLKVSNVISKPPQIHNKIKIGHIWGVIALVWVHLIDLVTITLSQRGENER